MYADDVQLYSSCASANVNEKVTAINEDLTAVYQWACGNGLCLNPTKSQAIIIFRFNIDYNNVPCLVFNDCVVNYVDKVRNLGIIFNRELSWSSHINCVVGKVYGMLRTLWVTQNFTPFQIRMTLAKMYLLPTLMYGCEIYANCDALAKYIY